MEQPRIDLPFIHSRRAFWRVLVHEAFSVRRMLRGERVCRLTELGSLPDDQLAKVKPIIHRSCEILVDQDYVCSGCKGTDVVVRLFPVAETANWVALGMFDGQHTLDEIGTRLSQAMNWDKARGFAHARDLFLSLAGRLICVPKEPSEAGD